MSKKDEKSRRIAFYRHAFAVSLSETLKEECDNGNGKAENAGDSCDNSAIKLDMLVSVLRSKPTVIYERLTFKRYLVTIIRLFKVAFIHKQTDSTVKAFWGIVE